MFQSLNLNTIVATALYSDLQEFGGSDRGMRISIFLGQYE